MNIFTIFKKKKKEDSKLLKRDGFYLTLESEQQAHSWNEYVPGAKTLKNGKIIQAPPDRIEIH